MLWVEHQGASYHKAFGKRALVPADEMMTEDTIFDAASLTKVVACTPHHAVGRARAGAAEERVQTYIPEFTGGGKEEVTVRQLITHTSGLRPDVSLKPDWSGSDAAIRLACAEKLANKPGEKLVYSDTGPILLGEIVRRVSGQPLDVFLQRELYGPLGMKDTGFNPPPEKLPASRRPKLRAASRCAAWSTIPGRAAWAGWRATPDCFSRRPIWRVTRGCCSTAANSTVCVSSSRRP